MKVSRKTVESHRARLMEQLGIRNVPGLARYAIRTELVSA
jgi:DNA-binding CsgD family transcriptional regulator